MRRIHCHSLTLAAALAALAAGCAPVPPGLLIASQFVDGVSYLATGKSSTDHLLSAALAEDCAIHRVISGIAVCQARQPDERQTAAFDGEAADADADDGADDSLAGTAESPAVAPAPLQIAGLGADMFFVPHHEIASAEAGPGAAAAAAGADQIAAVPPQFFVVLGSFAARENAERAARSAAHDARISRTRLGERWFYRVVAGPFDREAAGAARADYARAGYAGAWAARACAEADGRLDCVALD